MRICPANARDPELLVETAGEAAKALAGLVVWTDRVFLCELRIGRDLPGDSSDLFDRRRALVGIREQLVHPRQAAFRLDVVLDEQAPEQDANADVRERAESELPARRGDERGQLLVLLEKVCDELADGLVDERKPDVLGRHR